MRLNKKYFEPSPRFSNQKNNLFSRKQGENDLLAKTYIMETASKQEKKTKIEAKYIPNKSRCLKYVLHTIKCMFYFAILA